MEVYECIRARRTIREFKPDPVPEEVVYKILQAARWAPSSSNSQPWHFIVITDRDTLDAIGRTARLEHLLVKRLWPSLSSWIMHAVPSWTQGGLCNRWS
jgi:nitroreductase